MKGLFLDNFYKTFNSAKLFMFVILAAGIVLLITGNAATILQLFVYISITALSAIAVSGMRKDSEAKWDKYEITLPVTRKDIIKCKYLSYLFWVSIGVIISVVFTFVAYLIHGNIFFAFGLRDVLSLFALGIGIAVIVGSLFFPMAYVFGVNKSEALLVISVIAGVGLAAYLIWLLNTIFDAEVTNYYLILGVFVLTYCFMFVVSYLVTLKIYGKKNF